MYFCISFDLSERYISFAFAILHLLKFPKHHTFYTIYSYLSIYHTMYTPTLPHIYAQETFIHSPPRYDIVIMS